MKVLISGSTGLIGSALFSSLEDRGHEVNRLVRKEPKGSNEIFWDPKNGKLDCSTIEGFDGVVHLAGENVGNGRWTQTKKEKIRQSRIQGTTLLSQSLSQCSIPPRVLVCASAIGFYGDRGEENLDETSSSGFGFLPEVCEQWERSTQPANDKGIRVVKLRIGVVLSSEGGALKKMLFPFKMGGGGILGNGKQYFSWITLGDVVGAICHALQSEQLKGPVNAVSPNPVSNREFTKTLGKVLHRPTVLPIPAFAAKLAFGQMADELLLASTKVNPKALQESGFHFRDPKIEGALKNVLQKPSH